MSDLGVAVLLREHGLGQNQPKHVPQTLNQSIGKKCLGVLEL
jgi:hypothetical protein